MTREQRLVEPFYVSEDGGEIYVPQAAGWNAARHIAADAAGEIGDDWSRIRFAGKSDIPLHDHGDWEGCDECPAVSVYVFELYEGSYRA